MWPACARACADAAFSRGLAPPFAASPSRLCACNRYDSSAFVPKERLSVRARRQDKALRSFASEYRWAVKFLYRWTRGAGRRALGGTRGVIDAQGTERRRRVSMKCSRFMRGVVRRTFLRGTSCDGFERCGWSFVLLSNSAMARAYSRDFIL